MHGVRRISSYLFADKYPITGFIIFNSPTKAEVAVRASARPLRERPLRTRPLRTRPLRATRRSRHGDLSSPPSTVPTASGASSPATPAERPSDRYAVCRRREREMKRRLARTTRRDRIVTGLRKPVQRIRLVELAQIRNWDEVFRLIDKGKAGVNDFIPYVRRVGCRPSPSSCI